MAEISDNKYWDSYYTGSQASVQAPSIPSQFAIFVLGESPNTEFVIELGCGNGRDSHFFARHSLRVLGIDSSEAAVEKCTQEAILNNFNSSFIAAQIGKDDFFHRIEKHIPSSLNNSLLYARFFIHAIDDAAEDSFFKFASNLARRGALIAVEFRTDQDEKQEKITGAHYRRFIKPLNFHRKIVNSNLAVKYFVEGRGFAKYKDDDAHVARFIIGLE